MAHGLSNGQVTSDVTWPPEVLWGSTVGCPSDSLAFCYNYYYYCVLSSVSTSAAVRFSHSSTDSHLPTSSQPHHHHQQQPRHISASVSTTRYPHVSGPTATVTSRTQLMPFILGVSSALSNWSNKLNVKRALCWETPSQSYGTLPAVRANTMLPGSRCKWTHPALTPAMAAGTWFTYHGGTEGWVDIDGWLHTYMVYLLTADYPSKY